MQKPSSLFRFILMLGVLTAAPSGPMMLAQELPAAQAAAGDAEQVGAAQQAGVGDEGELLHVLVRKSVVLNSQDVLRRVSVADPNLASAVIISPRQVLVNGLAPGETTLVIWNEADEARFFELRVQYDLRRLEEAIRSSFPTATVAVGQSRNAIILTGRASNQATADQITAVAKTEAENVVNLLAAGRSGNQSVLLQVRFAEVNRAAVQELGVSFFSTGAGNTHGATTTQQFQQFQGNIGAVPSSVQRGRDPQTPSLAAGGVGNRLQGSPAVFGLSDLANIFLFRPDINLGVTIRALQQKNLLEILAEPNVLALNGREASFLAGGEFPIPVVQGGGNFQSVTIVFKEFGVRLKFKPEIQEDGSIVLQVAPEVSSLDYANALTISGFLVPALSTRRAETQISLRDGQSFAIAGLIDNRLSEIASKIPGLGDIPFLGKLFRSRAKERANTELLVLVTPKLVSPFEPGASPAMPRFPQPLEDGKEFGQKSDGPGRPDGDRGSGN